MTTPAATPDPDRIRASDADRERVAAVVHQAMGDGRLTLTEVDERLKNVYAAKTFADLRPIVADLPGHELALPAPHEVAIGGATEVTGPARHRIVGGVPKASAVAVFSGTERKGNWVVPEHLDVTAVFGGVQLDLTEALFAAPEVTIKIFAMMGGVEIFVPDDVSVVCTASGFMGGVDNRASSAPVPGAPIVRIIGVAIMGGVEIRPPKRRRSGWWA